jgi:hypothetical protein
MLPAMKADPFGIDVFAPLDAKLDVAVTDLVWWARALAHARAQAAT